MLYGKDAVILTEYMGINNMCIKENVCKCAIPVSKIEKFCLKLKSKRISFVLYDYSPKRLEQKEKIKIIERFIACPIYEDRTCFECSKCKHYKEFQKYQKNRSDNFKRLLSRINGETK